MLCLVLSHSVVSNSLWPCGPQPSRFLCPWAFSRQEYWSGLSFPFPGALPDPGIEPVSPALAGGCFTPGPLGKSLVYISLPLKLPWWLREQSVCLQGRRPGFDPWDLGSIPESGRSPGEGSGNPFQYSCLENPMDGEAWCRL